jgi:hypothetical protein
MDNEIKLTALQRAKKKYYEKIKNTEEYKNKKASPEIKAKLRECCSRYYNKIKNDEEFKRKVSQQKKEYYKRKKVEKLLEIIV